MTILRSGSTKKYSDNWANAFGAKKSKTKSKPTKAKAKPAGKKAKSKKKKK